MRTGITDKGERFISREQALQWYDSKHPLSPDERLGVIYNLGTALVALGCSPDRVEEMCDRVITDIDQPKHLHYLEALEKLEAQNLRRGILEVPRDYDDEEPNT